MHRKQWFGKEFQGDRKGYQRSSNILRSIGAINDASPGNCFGAGFLVHEFSYYKTKRQDLLSPAFLFPEWPLSVPELLPESGKPCQSRCQEKHSGWFGYRLMSNISITDCPSERVVGALIPVVLIAAAKT